MAESQPSEVIYSDLVVTRVLDAPIEKVWQFWTEPEKFRRWWGPATYTAPKVEMDLREGGKLLWCMQAPADQGGGVYCNAGIFRRIVPNERLEIDLRGSDEQGDPIPASDWGGPEEFDVEVQFESLGGKTVLTYIARNWPLTQMFAYAFAGMNQSLDKLEEAVKG
ncbi:MAG: SRPBCC domain-containing protein [Anaerolineae bacterium]|nr:SRPBCC domain-containing protein [Anaerolineae bacterium]